VKKRELEKKGTGYFLIKRELYSNVFILFIVLIKRGNNE